MNTKQTENIANLHLTTKHSVLSEARASKTSTAKDWVLMLVNATTYTVTHIRTKADPDWFKLLSPVGQTCTGTTPAEVDQCGQEHKFQPITVTPCDSGAFDLDLGVQIADKIYYMTDKPFNIRPSCGVAGGYIGVY